MPETKAARWMLGIAKDIVNCKEAISETKDSKILISKVKQNPMQKLFEDELKNLNKLHRNLDSDNNKTNLAVHVANAPKVVKSFQDQLRIWKKTKKASGAQ